MRATAANVGTPVLAPVWADGATTWQELHQVSARRFPAATSPISCAVRGKGEAARMAATASETWRRVRRAMQQIHGHLEIRSFQMSLAGALSATH
jgi:hypothetical protein